MNDPWHPIDCSGHVEITLPVGDAVEFVKMEQPLEPRVWPRKDFTLDELAAMVAPDTVTLYGEMVAMLEKLASHDDEGCAWCDPHGMGLGHSRDCKLNNLLKRVKGEA